MKPLLQSVLPGVGNALVMHRSYNGMVMVLVNVEEVVVLVGVEGVVLVGVEVLNILLQEGPHS